MKKKANKIGTSVMVIWLSTTFIGTTTTKLSNSSSGADGVNNYQNLCYDGENPKGWSRKKQLQKFAAGPCSPLIVLPGIAGSKLRVVIDCEILRNSSSEIFHDTCGWSGCGFWDNRPSREYKLWIPSFSSPLALDALGSKECFSTLLAPRFTRDPETNKIVLKKIEGLEVLPEGLTKSTSTYKASQCGTFATQNLLPVIINPDSTSYFNDFNNRMIAMGYVPGLTMQSLPYDFRLTNEQDKLTEALGGIIRGLKEITNKKVTILAHSMGNLRTAAALWEMEQEQKDELIENFISVAAPFTGSINPIPYLTCGSNEYEYPLGFGIDLSTFMSTIGNFSSVWQLLPLPTFSTQAEKHWMRKVMTRIAYENGEIEDPVFDFLPPRNHVCFANFEPEEKTKCSSGLYYFQRYGTTAENEVIDNQSLEPILEELSYSPHIREFWGLQDTRFEELPNLGVTLITIFSQVGNLNYKRINFKVNPKEWIETNKIYCTPSNGGFQEVLGRGDDTVPSVSASINAYKHMIDFEDGVEGAKPSLLVDLCSSFNQRSDPFDTIESTGHRKVSQNGYVGLECGCDQGHVDRCTHSQIMINENFINFVAEALKTGERTELSREVEERPESFFETWVKNCRLFVDNMAEDGVDYGENTFWRGRRMG